MPLIIHNQHAYYGGTTFVINLHIYVAKKILRAFKFDDRLHSENVFFFYGMILIMKLQVSMLIKVACHWSSSAFMLHEVMRTSCRAECH